MQRGRFSSSLVRAQAITDESQNCYKRLRVCLLFYADTSVNLKHRGTEDNSLSGYTSLDVQHFLLRNNEHPASFGGGGKGRREEKPTAVLSYKLSV